jgi:hypothetical protein
LLTFHSLLSSAGKHGKFTRKGCWPLEEFMASGSMFPAVRAVAILKCFMHSNTVKL